MSKPQYRPEVDGIRAIAVVCVVLFHANNKALPGGYVGVDVFFVISGFLITGLISGEVRGGQFALVNFWERRVRRIVPALAAMVILTLAAGWFLLMPSEFQALGKAAAAQAVLLQNVFFWKTSGYFDTLAEANPLLHTWTLAVEEQFYLIYPVLLAMVFRQRKFRPTAIVLAALIVSLGVSIWATHWRPIAAFFLLPTRAWELLLGGFIALWQPRIRHSMLREVLSALGLAAIIGAAMFFDSTALMPGVPALLPCVGVALVIGTNGGEKTTVGRVLSLPLFVRIGLISYSLYLWHWPLLVFARGLQPNGLSAWGAGPVVMLSFLLAWMSWKFVEVPFKRRSLLPARRHLFAAAAAASIVTGAVGAAYGTMGVLSDVRISQEARQYANAMNDIDSRHEECYSRNMGDATTRRPCVLGVGNEHTRPEFLVWGDSHSAAVMSGIDAVAKAQSATGWLASMPACPPILGVHLVDERLAPDCQRFNSSTFEKIKSHNIKAVVLIARWSAYALGPAEDAVDSSRNLFISDGLANENTLVSSKRVFAENLAKTVSALRQQDAEVWIMKQVPSYGFVVSTKLAKAALYGLSPESVGQPISRYETRQAFVSSVVKELVGLGTQLIDPTTVLCPKGNCMVFHGGNVLYRDGGHLTKTGALYIREIFNDFVREAVALSSKKRTTEN